MLHRFSGGLILCMLLGAMLSAHAQMYQVGPGKTYATLAAVPALAPGDIVEIYSATYNEVMRWTAAGTAASPITIRGMGAMRPVIDATGFTVDGVLPRGRAAFQIEASYVVIENIEFKNSRNGSNGAGIRVTTFGSTTTNVTIRNCKVGSCDMGIVGDSYDNLLIESCEVFGNGTSLRDGYTHNFYLGGNRSTVQYCYIHDSTNGLNFKTRGHYTELLYNYIADSQDGEVDLVDDTVTTTPNSNAVMIGNVIVSKPRLSGYNSARFVHFGMDSGDDHNGTLYAFNNTFVAGDSRIEFFSANATSSAIVARNNIFAGSTSLGSGSISGSNNWVPTGMTVPSGFAALSGSAPGFVNASSRDYHLTSASVCKNIGTSSLNFLDGSGAARSGTPTREYVHPLQSVARSSDGQLDAGAYEYSSGIVNQPPVAASQSVSTTKNTPCAITLSASDPEGGALTYIVVTQPAHGALSGSASNLTYTPANKYSGSDSFTFRANDGLNNSNTATVSIAITRRAPVLTSSLIATPNPATPGATVTFTAAATDADGDALTYGWTFGDGTTGTAGLATHAYAAAGNFHVNVTVTDEDGLTTTGAVNVMVNASNNGGGGGSNPAVDSDRDGVSDENELADGTNPNDAQSFVTLPFSATMLSGFVNFKVANRDACSLSGSIPNLADFKPEGAKVVIDAGGAAISFVLDARGRAKNDSGSFMLKSTSRKRKNATPAATFSVRLKNGSWSDEWAKQGIVNATSKASPLTMHVRVTLNGRVYAQDVSIIYSARQDSSGRFKMKLR